MSEGVTQWPGGNAGVSVPGANVLVSPTGDGGAQRAHEVAAAILDTETRFAILKTEIERQERVISGLRDRAERAESRLSHQRVINEAAIAGKRRFFSAVLMAPKTPGDWSGEVWLMDPVKQLKGNALRFASLAEVHAEHPELWVIGTTADGVLLDAWGGK